MKGVTNDAEVDCLSVGPFRGYVSVYSVYDALEDRDVILGYRYSVWSDNVLETHGVENTPDEARDVVESWIQSRTDYFSRTLSTE